MRTLFHPSIDKIELSTLFYALSDPVRLQLVKSLSDGSESSCGAFGVEIAKSTLSHHFKVLRESGVIHTRIEGTQRFVSLRKDEWEERFPGLIVSIIDALQSSSN